MDFSLFVFVFLILEKLLESFYLHFQVEYLFLIFLLYNVDYLLLHLCIHLNGINVGCL